MLQKGVDTVKHLGILGLHEVEEQGELVGYTWLSFFLFDGLILEIFEVLAECSIESDEDLRV